MWTLIDRIDFQSAAVTRREGILIRAPPARYQHLHSSLRARGPHPPCVWETSFPTRVIKFPIRQLLNQPLSFPDDVSPGIRVHWCPSLVISPSPPRHICSPTAKKEESDSCFLSLRLRSGSASGLALASWVLCSLSALKPGDHTREV